MGQCCAGEQPPSRGETPQPADVDDDANEQGAFGVVAPPNPDPDLLVHPGAVPERNTSVARPSSHTGSPARSTIESAQFARPGEEGLAASNHNEPPRSDDADWNDREHGIVVSGTNPFDLEERTTTRTTTRRECQGLLERSMEIKVHRSPSPVPSPDCVPQQQNGNVFHSPASVAITAVYTDRRSNPGERSSSSTTRSSDRTWSSSDGAGAHPPAAVATR